MLRVLHTSDWHLGHTLHGRDRRYEHACFLGWLLQLATDQRVDALLVAGDVFETANPPASALSDFYRFLVELRRRCPDIDIVVIAGNHDSAARFDASAPVLDALGVRIVGGAGGGGPAGVEADEYANLVVPLKGAGPAHRIEAWVAAVPYLRVADLPDTAPPSQGDPLIAGVAELYGRVLAHARARQEPDQALLAMGHCYMSGTKLSELSERKILGGNQHALPVAIFPDDVDYVALGHLHLAQAVDAGTTERVRYSGSPIPLSLREADYRHQVLMVGFQDGELSYIHEHEVPRVVDVLRIPEEGVVPLEEAVTRLSTLEIAAEVAGDERRWPYVEVRVHVDEPQPRLRAVIEEAVAELPIRLLRIEVQHAGIGGSLADWRQRRKLEEVRPQQVFSECFERQFGQKPDETMLGAFEELLHEVQGP